MPFSYEWYIEGQVVYLKVWGDQTIDELYQSNETMLQFLEAMPADRHFIHLIVFDEQLGTAPTNIRQINKILTYGRHPNLGWVVMTGDKPKSITDFVVTMLAKITRARFIRYVTIEEAIDHLKSVDPSINWDNTQTDILQMYTIERD